jgi:TRAP-type C4-dicarboxylate transport system permease small subunit
MKAIRAIDHAVTMAVTVLLICSFTVMLALAALQLFLRGALHASVSWGDVAARSLVIWVGFFGAYLATRSGRHFHIDILTRLFPPRAGLWINSFTDLFTAVVCLFLVRAGATFVTTGLDPAAVLFLGIRQTAAAMIVPVGFGLIALQLLLRTAESVTRALSRTAAEGPR